ncbi:MAG: hypothetical protein JJ975_01670, partial [Bacteroidia bacterium]|nr:hypothetical protein [Bacteroidia bacterium]
MVLMGVHRFMRVILVSFLLLCNVLVSAQDTLFYDTLIRNEAGEFLNIRYTSEITGIEEKLCLKRGVWDFYGAGGELYKRATYKALAKQQTSVLEGTTYYFDEEGDTVLIREYHNNTPVRDVAKREVVIIEGSVLLDVQKEYGEFVLFEHLDRHKSSRIQSEYSNLRASNELAYYLPTEERLKSEHLLDTAAFWPNHPRNHISNPMFEHHPRLQRSTASIRDEVTGWEPASPTPDFYYSEDCKSGTGCLGFRVYSLVKDIEYLQNRLVKPLKKDSFYCFSLYVKLANQCGYTSNGLGIHFSKKPIKDLSEVI